LKKLANKIELHTATQSCEGDAIKSVEAKAAAEQKPGAQQAPSLPQLFLSHTFPPEQ
jgi:hypothetical protein